jgi:hypothetical protein
VLTLALGASVIGPTPVAAAPAQEPTVPLTVAGELPVAPQVEPAPDAVVAPDAPAVAEVAPESSSRPLFTESRKIVAIIGGLVFVALALLLLTIRYWRVTRPVPVDAAMPEPVPVLDPVFVVEPDRVSIPASSAVPASVAAADHRPDATWEPRGTGEHAAVQLQAAPLAVRPGSPVARPPRQARQAALARRAEGVQVDEAR